MAAAETSRETCITNVNEFVRLHTHPGKRIGCSLKMDEAYEERAKVSLSLHTRRYLSVKPS